MNAQHTARLHHGFVPSVIPRFSEKFGALVFLIDDFEEDKAKAFEVNTKSVRTLTMDEYKNTERLSENDIKYAVDVFKTTARISEVNIRARKRYTKAKIAKVADRLAKSPEVPVEQKPVLEAVAKAPQLSKSEAAKERANNDALAAAVVSLQKADDKEKAVKDLAEKIAAIIASVIK